MTVKQLIGELQKFDSDLDILLVDLLNGDVSKVIYASDGKKVSNYGPCVYLVHDVVHRNAQPLASLPTILEDED